MDFISREIYNDLCSGVVLLPFGGASGDFSSCDLLIIGMNYWNDLVLMIIFFAWLYDRFCLSNRRGYFMNCLNVKNFDVNVQEEPSVVH